MKLPSWTGAVVATTLALICSDARASCVVALVSPSVISIAADGKLVRMQDNTIVSSDRICKIHQAGSFSYASVGLLVDSNASFDVAKIVESARRSGEPLKSTVDRFDGIMASAVSAEAQALEKSSPTYFSRRLRGGTLVDICFFAFENGSSVAYDREFNVGADVTDEIRVGVVAHDFPDDYPNGSMFLAIGANVGVDQYLQLHPGYLSSRNPATVVETLVEAEENDEPAIVGDPIAVMQIDAEGTRWVEQPSVCPNVAGQ